MTTEPQQPLTAPRRALAALLRAVGELVHLLVHLAAHEAVAAVLAGTALPHLARVAAAVVVARVADALMTRAWDAIRRRQAQGRRRGQA